MTKRNPKQVGTCMFDCKPQQGLCPLNCNQCFYNRPGAFYVDPDESHMPSVDEVGDGILRVNSGHDSNINKRLAIAATDAFPRRFFNTAIPKFDFPAPVVFTANREEEKPAFLPPIPVPANIMFVRLRVSTTNLAYVGDAVDRWTRAGVPVVLTFMAYYDAEPSPLPAIMDAVGGPCYVWQTRTVNSYWCAIEPFRKYVISMMKAIGGRLVSACGLLGASKCVDCRNCETYYLQTVKHLLED